MKKCAGERAFVSPRLPGVAAAAFCPVLYSPPQKVEEKGNWFHGPSETEKGALAGITL